MIVRTKTDLVPRVWESEVLRCSGGLRANVSPCCKKKKKDQENNAEHQPIESQKRRKIMRIWFLLVKKFPLDLLQKWKKGVMRSKLTNMMRKNLKLKCKDCTVTGDACWLQGETNHEVLNMTDKEEPPLSENKWWKIEGIDLQLFEFVDSGWHWLTQ